MDNNVKKELEDAIVDAWYGNYELVAISHLSKTSRYTCTNTVSRENIDDLEIYDGCVLVIKSASFYFTMLMSESMKFTKESYGTFVIEDDDSKTTISFIK